MAALPGFVEPMLAKSGEPFDSDEHLFEIKWDGTRALAFVEAGSYRLANRRKVEMTWRYPELEVLAKLPSGSLLDGEIVVLEQGKSNFNLLQTREQARSEFRVQNVRNSAPATFIAFDLLYHQGESILKKTLQQRRALLGELLEGVSGSHIIQSDGIVGPGREYFERACSLELEGVMAKRLKSRYLPGKRSDAWQKIKRTHTTLCAVVGFVPSGQDDFQSLILGEIIDGELRCVGRVGSGFVQAQRDELNALLWSRLRPKPLVSTSIKGKWVEPGLFCKVRFLERTVTGEFRAPVFDELIME